MEFGSFVQGHVPRSKVEREGRFERGTGRGAGSREGTGFDIESTDITKAAWDEATPTMDDIEFRINEGYLLCGDPDEVIEQVRRYEAVGCDQLVFSLPLDMPLEAATESIRLFGEQVIPTFDPAPVHRATRMRETAAGASAVPTTAS